MRNSQSVEGQHQDVGLGSGLLVHVGGDKAAGTCFEDAWTVTKIVHMMTKNRPYFCCMEPACDLLGKETGNIQHRWPYISNIYVIY